MLTDLTQDLQYSFRMLVKSPLFTIVAVLTLALGIGLNTATFSAVHGILLRPLGGVESPDRLVQLYAHWPGNEYALSSIPHYQDLRDRTGDLFEQAAAWTFTELSFAAEGSSERLIANLVSANFFQTYGVTPVVGRAFLPGVEDRTPGAHAVAVLGYSFWQAKFAGDPSVVGRTIRLNGQTYEIVGVAPSDFIGPLSTVDVPIYVPLMMEHEIQPGYDMLDSREIDPMNVVARLRQDKTIEDVRLEMESLLLQLGEEYPDDYEGQLGTTVVPQSEAGIHPMFRTASLGMSGALMAVVGLLLLIACVNVANLFLVRARERQREMGIRLSLGAARARIVQQLLTESLVFSLLAGLAGLGLAWLATGLIEQVRPPVDVPIVFEAELSLPVLLFTAVVTGLVGLIFGMAPALQSARSDVVNAVKGQSSQTGKSPMSSALVVAQMALSLILLVSSGLFLRSLQGATEIDPGFDQPESLAMASLVPSLQGYDPSRSQALFDRLQVEVAALPNVTSVGFTSNVALGFKWADQEVVIPGYEFAEGERRSFLYATVSEGFFESMGIDLLEGRAFERRDGETAEPVIIVNHRFAERFWPGESALGRIVHTAGSDRQVIGVVETGKYLSLGEDPTEHMYLPQRQGFRSDLTILARTSADPQSALRGIREITRKLDPDLPLFDVRTMEDHMGIALLPARLGGSVLGIFGVLGLMLAAIGIYGVMAYSVAQRQRELGIRVALGADRTSVVRLFLGEGMKLALLGTSIGLVGALLAGQLAKGLLYNVSAMDPVAFGLVPTLLIVVAALAVLVPARRAARIDPIRVLKID